MGFYIDMIDVGEGDSFLLTLDTPSGGEAHVLIDAGTEEQGKNVIDFLTRYSPKGLDLVIATHIDNDHIGGMKAVVENFTIGKFAMNVPPVIRQEWFPRRKSLEVYKNIKASERLIKSIDTLKDLVQALADAGVAQVSALAGQQWTCGDIMLNVLNPTQERLAAAWQDNNLLSVVDSSVEPIWAGALYEVLSKSAAPATSAENDASVVIEIEHKGSPYALMAADAGAAVLAEITKDRTYKFLKVPHHGSETGLTSDLIKQWKPGTAFVPVGDNPHGHPAGAVLDMLRELKVKTFCSTRTKHCRRECGEAGFGNLCHKVDKEFRPGWSSVDPSKCANNNGQH
jgi:beta-lactamase superfamily II metal-dependent hydrolase